MYNIYLDTFHNIYGIIFCFQALYYSFNILNLDLSNHNDIETLDTNYDAIMYYSTIYFVVSGIINILDKSYLFLVHHIISWLSLYYGTIINSNNSNNSNYKYWMCLNFLAEISTIFLSLDAVIKNLSVITGVGNKYKIFNLTLKCIFTLFYTLIRILFLTPTNLSIMLFYQKNYFDSSYFALFIKPCLFFMICLNIYWFVLLVKKVYLTFNKEKTHNE